MTRYSDSHKLDRTAYDLGKRITWQFTLNHWDVSHMNTTSLRQLVDLHNHMLQTAYDIDQVLKQSHGLFATEQDETTIAVTETKKRVLSILSFCEGIRDELLATDEYVCEDYPLFVIDEWFTCTAFLRVIDTDTMLARHYDGFDL